MKLARLALSTRVLGIALFSTGCKKKNDDTTGGGGTPPLLQPIPAKLMSRILQEPGVPGVR